MIVAVRPFWHMMPAYSGRAVVYFTSLSANPLLADATDSDFWERVRVKDNIDLVVLAMPKHSANIHAAEALKRHEYVIIVLV